jgi:hypothetical protein
VARWSLRTTAALAVAGCAGLIATKAVGRRRALCRSLPADRADRHLADDMMDALATDEGMPEPGERLSG